MKIKGLNFKLTCSAFPEQYDVFKNRKIVGYVRLRHGTLRCDYPECGGETIYEKIFDSRIGMFENNFQKVRELNKIATIINKVLSKKETKMKKYLKSVEEVVKALKEGKKVKDEENEDVYQMVDGIIYGNYNNGEVVINDSIVFTKTNLSTEEPELLKFEVNRAYKTRDDSKVFLFKIKTFGAYEYYFIGDYGVKFWVDIEGKFKENQESPFDIVGYWEEEK